MSDWEPTPGSPTQKIAQRIRIRIAPGDAALAGDPLEITDHMHAEVSPWWHRRGTHLEIAYVDDADEYLAKIMALVDAKTVEHEPAPLVIDHEAAEP
jgi:hypothetical protein